MGAITAVVAPMSFVRQGVIGSPEMEAGALM